MIRCGQATCINLAAALEREWLETNGIGGYACSTIIGLNTRRYHGLLTAAIDPPVGRAVLLSKLEETLVVGGREYPLSANQYPGVVHPEGYLRLVEFRLEPFPTFVYEAACHRLTKIVFMVHGVNTTVIRYRAASLDGEAPAVPLRLRVAPLIAFRYHHALQHENESLDDTVREENGMAMVHPYPGLPPLHLANDAAAINVTGWWYRNLEYEVERRRGLDFREDLFNPFELEFDLADNAEANLIASPEWVNVADAATYQRREIERRARVLAPAAAADEFTQQLAVAAERFVVRRGDQHSVIAGYPWFADWGRDTMISLPGLALATGRPDVARSILTAFASCVDEGMLPNCFPEHGEKPQCNTVDATLWFFEAVRATLQQTGDYDWVRTILYPVLTSIIDWHLRGTRFGIHVEGDGLLHAGEPGVQLTWMDAKIGDWVVTPRHGKPVEIQALWYNALRIMQSLADRFKDARAAKNYASLADRAQASFNRLFWNPDASCLYDVVSDSGPDSSLRPNQVFAVSLPYSMLTPVRARQVVEVVQKRLLTEYGLRTLAPGDPQYVGYYGGDQRSRDAAYHQGTVWPWLMGPFITAYLNVNGRAPTTFDQVRRWLEPLRDFVFGPGLGNLPEIFDADPPRRPHGCFAQAWSVAELLRICVQELGQGTPKSATAQPGV